MRRSPTCAKPGHCLHGTYIVCWFVEDKYQGSYLDEFSVRKDGE